MKLMNENATPSTPASTSRKSKIGPLVTGLVSVVALFAIGATYLVNASPYVDIPTALSSHGDNMHVAGQIDKTSLKADYASREIKFTLQDEKQHSMPVSYSGEAIENIGEADKVVAIGGMQNGVFVSHKLLIKCPSKYGDKQAAAGKTS